MPTFDLSKRIVKYLTIAVAMMVFTILATTLWMAKKNNDLATENSRAMVFGGLNAQIEELGTLNIDYAWWDGAVDNIRDEEKEWLHSNIGSAVTESETMDHLIITKPNGDILVSYSIDAGEQVGTSTAPPEITFKMYELAVQLPISPIVTKHKLLKFSNTLYLFTITRVTPQNDFSKVDPASLPYIIMGRDLSSVRLSDVGKKFLIDDLRFTEQKVETGQLIEIEGENNSIIGYLAWTPSKPGNALLQAVAPPLSISLFVFIAIAAWVNRHFGKAVAIVETSLISAQAADQAKTDFLSNISHELRTPMNGVLTMAHVLSTTELNEDQSSILEVILESSEIQMQIINEILDFSILDSGALQLEEFPFSLSEMITSATTLLDPKARAKDLKLTSFLSPNLSDTVVGDAVRVRQIFTNLLSNAIKFTDNGSVKLEISGSQKGGMTHLIVAVSDTGIGIEEDQLMNIFERFWQVDSSKTRRADGNGLGLSNIKITVEKLKGKIDVESEIGKGSTFTVSFDLPLIQAVSLSTSSHNENEKAA